MTSDDQNKKRIMVVDDEDDVNVTLRIVLEHQFSVDVFNDPFVALNNFKPGLYDLLLIDIRMPKMNGLVLYNKLREIDSKVKVWGRWYLIFHYLNSLDVQFSKSRLTTMICLGKLQESQMHKV